MIAEPTHSERIRDRQLFLTPTPFVDGVPRLQRLLTFEWFPLGGLTLAAAFLELNVGSDTLPNDANNLIDLALVVAADGGAAGAAVDPVQRGQVTNFSQNPAGLAAAVGAVAYTGAGVYNLAATQGELVSPRCRAELWGRADPGRDLVVSGTLLLAIGTRSDARTLDRIGPGFVGGV